MLWLLAAGFALGALTVVARPVTAARVIETYEKDADVGIRSVVSTLFIRVDCRHTSEEVAMQNLTATPATSLDGAVDPHQVRTLPMAVSGTTDGRAAAHPSTVWLGRHVNAGDLHPGDVVQQFDWALHVYEVIVSQAAVAIAVTEFGFLLHYAADEQVRLAA